MIVCHVKDLASLFDVKNKHIERALNWLKSTDLDALPIGKQVIDGVNVFALISSYETKPLEEGKYEYHEKYIDFQYLTAGKELIYVVPTSAIDVNVPYSPEKDIAFGSSQAVPSLVVIGDQTIVQLDPLDGHMPCIQFGPTRGTVRKIVIKVKVV